MTLTPAEVIARAFHEAYERLAPEYGYRTPRDSKGPWATMPETNRQLMVAAMQDLLDMGLIAAPVR